MAAPVPESRACACSTPRRRAGRLPCALPSPALPPPGPMRRKWSLSTSCPCERGSPGRAGQASRYSLRWIARRAQRGGFNRAIGGGDQARESVPDNEFPTEILVLLRAPVVAALRGPTTNRSKPDANPEALHRLPATASRFSPFTPTARKQAWRHRRRSPSSRHAQASPLPQSKGARR